LAVPATGEEVHGVCRTARALSEESDVHISHGDLAALPAVAAGAVSVGTGWDPRQRVCSYASYEARGAVGDGGQWFQQSTLEGLLSLLTRGESELLFRRDQTLATRLLPGNVPPGPKEAFLHHADVLSRITESLSALNPPDAFAGLRDRYIAARNDWPTAAAAIGVASRADSWLSAPESGLELYAATEGF
jgi:hypothetical protein